MGKTINKKITLEPIGESDREKFIKDLQDAFTVAVVEEFGEATQDVISPKDIEESMDAKGAETYHILLDGNIVGGTVLVIDPETRRNSLDLLFIRANEHGSDHSKGIGLSAWKAIEELHPETEIWETHTPYFEKRNIHFYINKCGFQIVEFYNPHHLDPHVPAANFESSKYFFRFEKVMNKI